MNQLIETACKLWDHLISKSPLNGDVYSLFISIAILLVILVSRRETKPNVNERESNVYYYSPVDGNRTQVIYIDYREFIDIKNDRTNWEFGNYLKDGITVRKKHTHGDWIIAKFNTELDLYKYRRYRIDFT